MKMMSDEVKKCLEENVKDHEMKDETPDKSGEEKRRLSPSCSTQNPKRVKIVDKAAETENSQEGGSQDCNDNPPRLSFELPKLSDLPKASKSWNDVDLPIDILLLTVEDCEFLGCFYYLDKPFKSYCSDIGYVCFGSMGYGNEKKLKIALMKCSKGSAVPGGSLTVVKNAVGVLRPKAVFSVGACSGLNDEKTKLGDVVVSSKLITLAHKTPASRNIGYLIRHVADSWKAPLENPDVREVRVHRDGEVLSSQEAVNEDIIQQYPEAIAVEKEGEGLFAAAHDLKTEWVLIKGIKDYADGSQSSSDEWGVFASVMAASVVANILSDSVVFEKWSHYNQENTGTGIPTRKASGTQEASPTETFDVKTCRSKLAEHYKRTAKVPTSVWSKTSPVDIHQIYTRLSWVKEEQTPAGSSQSKLTHYTDVFTPNKNGDVPNRILVQGQTGIGKSTFVKKLAVDWAELDDEKTEDKQGDALAKNALKKFKLVLVINLKEVSKCQSLRDVISHCKIFPEEEKALTDGLLSYITKNQEKVLLVFDGYDEYRCGINSEIYEIFEGTKLRNCCVLITTRISKADKLRVFKDVHAEITGFSQKDGEAFMRRMLGGETEAEELMCHLSRENLTDLARVPLLLLFFCTLWKQGKLQCFPGTKTKLYLAIVQHVLYHSQGKQSPARFGKVQDFKDILAEIGKVALECLLKDDHVFEYDQLSAAILCDESLIIGLLQITEYAENLRPAGMVSFIHKSIQEFLAAWYITYRCVPEGNLGEIEEHARTLEDCKAWENVFQFICGLSDDGAMKVLEHLKSVRISDPELDLSKIIPDVENETDVPLCDVTEKHRRFSELVYNSFHEVHSTAKLLSHCFNCTGGIVLVTEQLTELLQKAKVKDLTQVTHSVIFRQSDPWVDDFLDTSILYLLVEFLDCLHVPLRITESSEVLTVGDFLTCYGSYFFNSILCFRNGQFQFYITELSLWCDEVVTLFTETTDICVKSLSTNLCSEQSCMKFLTSLFYHDLRDQAGKVLGGLIRNSKHLKLIEVMRCDDSICDLLEQVVNPSECSLVIGFDRPQKCHLTSAGAVRLARLLPQFNDIFILPLNLNDCCAAAVDTLVSSITHKTFVQLRLIGISLTPAVAAALGRSLPEMSSLQALTLTGADGSIVQAEEMEALFGGFNKTLPLEVLTFSGFSVISCLAPLTKSFRFFPNLIELYLEELNMDEHDLRGLLESFQFIPNLNGLDLSGSPLGHAVTYIVPHIINLPKLHWLNINQTGSEEDLNNVRETIKQAKPRIEFLNVTWPE